MTYSSSACGKLDYWFDNFDGRALIVMPAFFRSYKPRKGFADTLERLSDEDDCQVACYIPGTWIPLFVFTEQGMLDVRQTFHAVLRRHGGTLLTLGAYTCELEVDLVSA